MQGLSLAQLYWQWNFKPSRMDFKAWIKYRKNLAPFFHGLFSKTTTGSGFWVANFFGGGKVLDLADFFVVFAIFCLVTLNSNPALVPLGQNARNLQTQGACRFYCVFIPFLSKVYCRCFAKGHFTKVYSIKECELKNFPEIL